MINIKDLIENKIFDFKNINKNKKHLIISNNFDNDILNGIEKCENLESLVIKKCNIIDVSPLTQLKNLRKLTLRENKNVINLDMLNTLPKLDYLILSNIHVGCISDIKNLTNLKYLNLSESCILHNHVHYLKNLINLQYLNLSYAGLYNLYDLSKFINLKELILDYNCFDVSITLEPLNTLNKLEYLSLGNTGLFNIKGISDLKNLKYVYLKYNNIRDFSELLKLKSETQIITDRRSNSDVFSV